LAVCTTNHHEDGLHTKPMPSRYNLKRRVASLPPLSSEIFAEKVLNAQASSSAAAAKAAFEKPCEPCHKVYYSENAYRNHVGSQKHRLRVAAIANGEGRTADDETTSVMSSAVSLGEPLDGNFTRHQASEAEAEFSEVVKGIKETSLEEKEPVSRRPSRPHHSAAETRPEHPLSLTTQSSTPTTEDTTKGPGDVSPNRCLFCNYDSPTLRLNVMHMTKFHNLFIPEQPYLVDLEGLIGYLQGKVVDQHECLFCHKSKHSASGAQTHMKDKGHCMIAFDSEEDMIEVGQFYDFRSSYSDEEEEDDEDTDMEDTPSGGVKLGSKRSGVSKATVVNSNGDELMIDGDENGDGWETDSSASSLDSAELHAVPIDHDHAYTRLPMHRHHSHNDPRPHRTFDGFHSHAHSHYAVFRSDYELHLPSGRTAGHRSLARYYRQNLHNYPTAEERIQQRLIADETADGDGSGEIEPQGRGRQAITRANGGMGMIGVTDAKKREVAAVEKRERKAAQRLQKHYQWGVDKRGNSQKHFRDPLLQ
jgi:pre-60S factor REI1